MRFEALEDRALLSSGYGDASALFTGAALTAQAPVGSYVSQSAVPAEEAFADVREGLGLDEAFVPDHPGIAVTAAGGGDPQFQIDTHLPAVAGGQISVPVKLQIEPAATNVGGFDFDLYFDPSLLAIVAPGDVSPGADTTGSWVVAGNLAAAGHLRVVILNTAGQPLAPGVREVAQLLFSVAAGAATGVTPLDIEPGDPAAGGYTWTASDGSVWIGAAIGWHNEANPLDVSGDGVVEPLDALIIINYINAHPGEVALPAPGSTPHWYYDVTNDEVCTALDALIVINYLNAQSQPLAEGEAPPTGIRATPSNGGRSDFPISLSSPCPLPMGEGTATEVISAAVAAVGLTRGTAETGGGGGTDRLQEQLFGDEEPELSPLEAALADLAGDIDSAWRRPA